MNDSGNRTTVGDDTVDDAPAEQLRGDRERVEIAGRLLLRNPSDSLDRLADLAARLLGASTGQVSLLTDVQVVAARAGALADPVGTETPLENSFCAVSAAATAPLVVSDAQADARVSATFPAASGQIGSYLGTPLVTTEGEVVGVLCVYDAEPREWSAEDLATLQRLSSSVMTELELSALVREYEGDQLRWGLATDAAKIGTFDWDLTSGRLTWDDRLIAMFGYDTEGFDESIEAFNDRLHPDDLPRVTEALQTCIDTGGSYEALYRIVLPTGETRWIEARGRALREPDGTTTRVLGAAFDTTDQRDAGMRVTRVLEAMPAGFYSLDRDWRFTHVNAEAKRLLGRGHEELLGQVIWEAFPATVGSVFEEGYRSAVRSGGPVQFDAYYPAPLNGWYEVRAWPTPDGLSVYFLEVTQRRLAQERAERSTRQLAILAQVSAELAGTLDTAVATARLPRLVVPALADFCMVTIIGEDGVPRDVGSWHPDPAARSLLERYREVRLEAMPLTGPIARALNTGKAATFSGTDVVDLLPDGPARELLTLLAPETEVALPLRARGRTVGLLTLFYAPGHAPSADDVTVAQEVADRAGLALDNARLFSAQQQLAEGLQRSMLTDPPTPDHAEIAVRYLPAAEAARVGGDWYDAFLQASGTTMLVIGDVVGHDTEAAAAMGQLRSLLRGIATYSDAPPVEVLRGLDASMATLGVGTLATAAVARFEQTPEEVGRGVTRMRWANAGHLPPLVVNADGSVAELAPWVGDLMLGVDATAERHESVITLDRGSTVLLYTDGLVERRDADLDQGLLRLRTALTELAGLPLDDLLDEIIERLVQGRPDDDVALVAVRLYPE
ncbi:histidine kinase [Blastococcus sp. TF02-09]|uniref:SpoIIE family protein phosphatase n=1 Tax=Blastococcus sp. TF02-09 TaxID=2250576 RepID=UPI000DEBBAD6|nr:SpoIIE family protein phosphatase [Blastococcus sp. TF02-9]RBY76507.1 histidine kinase [Blastococcus sp. TF02-9]